MSICRQLPAVPDWVCDTHWAGASVKAEMDAAVHQVQQISKMQFSYMGIPKN